VLPSLLAASIRGNFAVQESIMDMTRRSLCSLLPALLRLAAVPAVADQEGPLPSATFEFDKLPVEERDHAAVRHIMKGKLATGEAVEVHETILPPNGYPHAPHHHVHSEMWLIREGTVQLTINGKSQVIGPGGLGFVRSNEEHGIRNVGSGPANYYVVAIGPGADTQA
jgi:mannose-6-phosphate isomerase-like protein (cupin superfamily)